MECAKYRVREEKFQDQRLIAEWGKNKEGEQEKKVRNETQREKVILTLNPTCKWMKLCPSLADNNSNVADWVPKGNVGYFIRPLQQQ